MRVGGGAGALLGLLELLQNDIGRPTFETDYILRPGVVTRSNALALMRSVGLDV